MVKLVVRNVAFCPFKDDNGSAVLDSCTLLPVTGTCQLGPPDNCPLLAGPIVVVLEREQTEQENKQ